MKVLVDMGHPSDFHFFKNMIWDLESRGHEVKITAREKEVLLDLLENYRFRYEKLGDHQKGLLRKAYHLVLRDHKIYKIAAKFKPDILIGFHEPSISHVAKLIGKPSITFADTEYAGFVNTLTHPFTNVICTPSCFREKLNPKKHVMFNGYKELAYLHPNHFKPDPTVLYDLNLSKEDKFIVLRFISWDAAHDMGLGGIKKGSEIKFVKSLEKYGKVFITSERKLNKDLEKYRITSPPEKIHSLLNYAQLYIGEGGTMAVESAVLGTPSIHIESGDPTRPSVASMFCGNFIELRDNYDMVYMFPTQEQSLKKAVRILENKNSKKEWEKKREKLLNDKIDVTEWMTNFIENYPDSFYEYINREK